MDFTASAPVKRDKTDTSVELRHQNGQYDLPQHSEDAASFRNKIALVCPLLMPRSLRPKSMGNTLSALSVGLPSGPATPPAFRN